LTFLLDEAERIEALPGRISPGGILLQSGPG
jgi:hypothetical protein